MTSRRSPAPAGYYRATPILPHRNSEMLPSARPLARRRVRWRKVRTGSYVPTGALIPSVPFDCLRGNARKWTTTSYCLTHTPRTQSGQHPVRGPRQRAGPTVTVSPCVGHIHTDQQAFIRTSRSGCSLEKPRIRVHLLGLQIHAYAACIQGGLGDRPEKRNH